MRDLKRSSANMQAQGGSSHPLPTPIAGAGGTIHQLQAQGETMRLSPNIKKARKSIRHYYYQLIHNSHNMTWERMQFLANNFEYCQQFLVDETGERYTQYDF